MNTVSFIFEESLAQLKFVRNLIVLIRVLRFEEKKQRDSMICPFVGFA